MYGADWPIFNFAKDCHIENVLEILNSLINKYFDGNQDIWNDIFHNNAIRIYKLD